MVASVTLLLLIGTSIYPFLIKQLGYIIYIAPILVFGMMMYYAHYLKQHKKTEVYGEQLATIEKTGFKTFTKTIAYWIILFLFLLAVLYFI